MRVFNIFEQLNRLVQALIQSLVPVSSSLILMLLVRGGVGGWGRVFGRCIVVYVCVRARVRACVCIRVQADGTL